MSILEDLSKNPKFRILFKNYLDRKRRKVYDRFLRSPDSWYLKTLQGIHTGERCFIIGNGPSLKSDDLDRLIGSYTFAANRIFEIFDQTEWRPTYYLLLDIDALREFYQILGNYDLGHMFLALDPNSRQDEKKRMDYPVTKMTRVIQDTNIYFDPYRSACNHKAPYISTDIWDHFSCGYTVTFNSIQLAIYMGFTEIYLLGIDFNYSLMVSEDGKKHKDETVDDYFSGKRYSRTAFNYKSNLLAYQVAREYCDSHHITIKNATRGGKLEVFERVGFDELFDNKQG